MASEQRMTFGVDLVGQTFYHLEFLRAVNNNKQLSRKAVLKRALYRYEKFWLPLAAEHPNECLSPPMDIEWIWHCHMLSPTAYEQDCYRIVQKTVNHTLYPPDAFQRSRNKAGAFWSEKYREPFYIDYSAVPDEDKDLNFSSSISYDILGAAERQTTFFYQVSLPHYRDKIFIEGALERYKKFLYLRKYNLGEFIVPCYDIDIVWHTHQLNPIVYKHDTVRITGSLFSHDDSVNDRKEGSKLSIADRRTRELWTKFYHESFSRCGSMYRGQPPNGQMYTITRNDEFECCAKSCTLSLERLTLNVSGKDLSQKYSLIISTAGSPESEVKRCFILKPPAHNRSGGDKTQTWSKVGSVVFDTHHEHGLLFTISYKNGLFGTKKDTVSAYLNLSPLIEFPSGASKIASRVKSRLTFQTNASVDIEFYIQNLKIQSASLQLEEGLYKTQSVSGDIQQMFWPVPLETLPLGNDTQCRTATHILKNHLGNPSFKVRTIHSAPLMTSVIHVFFKDKLCSMAHLIAADQLPLLTQVSPAHFATALNPKKGERAILIKNNNGDWGIVFGQWTGVRKGRFGIPGSCGTLRLTFYKMATEKCIQTDLVYMQKLYSVSIESSTSDLMNGNIKINPQSHELAENIALIFSISLLHVLCVPRLRGWPEGKPICVSYKRGEKLIEPVPSDFMKCIRAAGLLVNTPSNYYISQYGEQFWALCGGRGTSDDQTFIESSPEWRALPGGIGFEYSGDAGCGSCVGVRGWGGGYGFIGGGCGGDGGGDGGGGDGGGGCGGGGCGGGGCGGG